MTPHDFIAKWRSGGDERRDAQPFFEDLCRLLGHKTPREADPNHTWFTYEYGANKASGGNGWADVWKKGHFGWEAKGTHKDLTKAYAQLKMYADALENPPLLIVSDLAQIVIHTNFTNTVKATHVIRVEDLADHKARDLLHSAFFDPELLKPGVTRQAITEDAAKKFATLADQLRSRGHQAFEVAQFLNRLLFCMFAEENSINLLPRQLFTELVQNSKDDPQMFTSNIESLFTAMNTVGGGNVAFKKIPWFNGGLFNNSSSLALTTAELTILEEACRLDWSEIDPSIFGTLFERGLDPNKRSQLGAHYTDPEMIMKIIRPVVIEPWVHRWQQTRQVLETLMTRADIFGPTAKSSTEKAQRTRAEKDARSVLMQFLEELRHYTVLDPACGSGNFLYLSLRALKDIEHMVIVDAELIGLGRTFPSVGPANVKGIELNEYAAELARITIWIGEIQWMIQKGYGANQNPILRQLDQIECRDALLTDDQKEATWPLADAIVGNPPFIGNKRMNKELGQEYASKVRSAYEGRVPGGADFVCYWFEKANDAIHAGTTKRVGLVSTNSIRGGANREVLKHAVSTTRIFDAWSDLPWINEGASVRVSLSCFGESEQRSRLDDEFVDEIHADLTASASDVSSARRLESNRGLSFQGPVKVGSFDIAGSIAREWLRIPNSNGRPNSDVIKPWSNGRDITSRPSDTWIVDFGVEMSEGEASFYEKPYKYVLDNVKPARDNQNRARRKEYWWLHGETVPGLRKKLESLHRYIATPRVSKHRIFVWQSNQVFPDSALVVITRDDELMMGVLMSRVHELWSLRMGTSLGVGNDPRYTPSTTFETFPFPPGLEPNISYEKIRSDDRAVLIEAASKALIEARDRWLHPQTWVNWVRTKEEEDAGYPMRPIPKPGHEADLKKRTLTTLYNENPTWLADLRDRLDFAVASAYGWEWPLSEAEILQRLYDINKAKGGGHE